MALTSIPVKKQSVSFSLLELAYEILGKVEDLAACIRREFQKGQQQALLPVREGKFLSQLLDELWGMEKEVDERTVDVHVKRLRERFNAQNDFDIVTVRGLGYKAIKK